MDGITYQQAHAGGTVVLSGNAIGEWEVDCGPCDRVIHAGADKAAAETALTDHLREH